MQQALSKEQVLALIDAEAKKHVVIKNKTHADEWSANELLYCLEWINHEKDVQFCVQFNEISLPVDGNKPVFVPSCVRARHVTIVDVEVYEDIPIYVIVIEEVVK